MKMERFARTVTGRTLQLGKQLGTGGEGVVFEIQNDATIVAKLYHKKPPPKQQAKIHALVRTGWSQTVSHVSFPSDAIVDPSGAIIGFVMKRVNAHKPVHELYSPASRKVEFQRANFPFLIHAALNTARAFASVHQAGCVVGDVNHSGILVSADATVTLIDSDSFQCNIGNEQYWCTVGTPEFTPPELQNQRFDRILRTKNHDAFGLAVIIFSLLFMGRHPFAGRYGGKDDMPIPRAIKELRFAYSANAKSLNMQPPPNVPLLVDFPIEIANAFELAFGSDRTRARPGAEEWVGHLQKLKSELVSCSSSPSHHYPKQAPSCPWCRMEGASPGFIAFSGIPTLTQSAAAFNVAALVSALNGVRDPGATPAPINVVSPVTIGSPSNAVAEQRNIQKARYVVGAIVALAGVTWIIATPSLAFWGFIACIGGIVIGATASSHDKLLVFRRSAENRWRAAQTAWINNTSNDECISARREVEREIEAIKNLGQHQNQLLRNLEGQKREIQKRAFLERHRISNAKIRKISAQRKIVLASYGIETAADISNSRIQNISGFGPQLASNLLQWQRSVEAKFVYKAGAPFTAAELQRVNAEVLRKRTEHERKAKAGIVRLQQAAATVVANRQRLIGELNESYKSVKQAEYDVQAVAHTGVTWSPPRIVIVLAALVALFAYVVYSNDKRQTQPISYTSKVVPNPKQTYTPPQPASKPFVVPSAPKYIPPAPQYVPPASQNIPPPVAFPKSWQAPSPSPPLPLPPPSIGEQNVIKEGAQRKDDPPQVLPESKVVVVPEPPSITHDLLSLPGRVDVQKRLTELGYGLGQADGVWGPASRGALRFFRQTNLLGDDEKWDAETNVKLFSASALRAPQNTPPKRGPSNFVYAAPLGATRNPLNRHDAQWIQKQLRELGFYRLEVASDGLWGIASDEALKQFQLENGLNPNGVWDKQTEDTIVKVDAVSSATNYEGVWAPTFAQCSLTGEGGQQHIAVFNDRIEESGTVCRIQFIAEPQSTWSGTSRCGLFLFSTETTLTMQTVRDQLTLTQGSRVRRFVRCGFNSDGQRH